MDGVVLWCLSLLWATAAVEGLQVTVPEKKKVAMLFEPAVLRCQYSTSSRQSAVVQWKYKSYCQDRMEEALGLGPPAKSKKDEGWNPYTDCVDNARTVRIVASKQGSAVTLGEFYRERDITIDHDADLRFGKLQWGDSGMYHCHVIASDDPDGKNEGKIELLVMGKTGVLADLLPSFEVEIMPEWAFVCLVILGTVLFFVMVGLCWCQCCPHSCCCYVRCPCCPDTCCCPKALYEAGKAAKAGYPPVVPTNCPPYYISTVPVAPVPPPMLIEKQHVPPLVQSDSMSGQNAVRKGYRIQADKERDSMKVMYYVEKELAQFDPTRKMREKYNNTISELSSLHEEDSNFGRSYRQSRRKPPTGRELDGNAEYYPGASGGSTRQPTSGSYREERNSTRNSHQRPTSELLERKAFAMGVQAVSTDELAAFADSYRQKGRRSDSRGPSRIEKTDLRGRSQYQDSSLEGYYSKRNRCREVFSDSERGWSFSPSRIRVPEDKHLPKRVGRMGQSYDDGYLSSVLERKSKGLEDSCGSATPSKLSLRQSGTRYSRSPTCKAAGDEKEQQGEEEDILPPYSEREHNRASGYRSREHGYHGSSEKRKKKEPSIKTVIYHHFRLRC
ncbi:immunoglobulin-like domain-containing receptor 2 isoform X2 [Ambystoma mexicanum]|uniref:immunoglobulin-like domain-containing receptor 2 isoform X2 n=1 Tax=Ambystoma mexicanum TaxID=8296 RepID=UPI0037E979E0